MATPSPGALPSGLQAIMPNYIAAAIQKAKNIAASIRGYCNPVSRGSLTLPIGDVMRSVTSAQLGAAVERAALSLQDRTNQCREDVEELERADAIASRGIPADPAHWMRDIIVKFREAMTPEERAVNLRLALLDAERPVLATIAGLSTRETATITEDAISQIPFAISPPHTQVADREELERVMADKDDVEHKLQTAATALDAEKKGEDRCGEDRRGYPRRGDAAGRQTQRQGQDARDGAAHRPRTRRRHPAAAGGPRRPQGSDQGAR